MEPHVHKTNVRVIGNVKKMYSNKETNKFKWKIRTNMTTKKKGMNKVYTCGLLTYSNIVSLL